MEAKEIKFYLGCNIVGKVELSQQEIEWIRSPISIKSLISKENSNNSLIIKNSELVHYNGGEEKEIKYDHICYAKKFWRWFTLTFQYNEFPKDIKLVTDKIGRYDLSDYFIIRELSFLDEKKKLLWSYVIKNLISDLSELGVNTDLLCQGESFGKLEFSLVVSVGDDYNIYEEEKNYLLCGHILDTIEKYKKKYINKNIIKRLLLPDDEIYEGSCKYDLRAGIFKISYKL